MNLPAPPCPGIEAVQIAPRPVASAYPPPFAAQMAGRLKRALGDHFGLTRFGVNLTSLAPGACSALRHAHTLQDEFVYVLEGWPSLISDAGCHRLAPGMCVGFKAGSGNAHQLRNLTTQGVVYLEIGDRTPGDLVTYPDDDLIAIAGPAGWRFTRKDGTPY
jgi:uncharacterized cupin superfamily protein